MTDASQTSFPGMDGPADEPDQVHASPSAPDVQDDAFADPPVIEQPSVTTKQAPLVVAGEHTPVAEPLAPEASGGSPEPSETGDGAATSPTSQPAKLYYLTNRLNLNGILSSRIVGPRECFDKYYADLLEMCPGWVPLLIDPPTQDLLDRVTAERGSGGPAILEFPADLPGVVSHPESAVAYAPAVALTRATAIHLRDKRSVKEQLARSYGNIHNYSDMVRLTPELFEGAPVQQDIRTPEVASPHIDWQRVDRIRGALSASLSAAETGEELSLVARCMGATTKDESQVPRWFSWNALNDLDIDGHRADAASDDADLALFDTAYDILARTDAAEAWSPRVFLDAVEEGVTARISDLTVSATIKSNLDRIRAIVNVEADFQPLTGKGGLTSAKSILLTLLRVDLAQLNAWPEGETGADDQIRVTAAILAGRLRGVSRESTELRSVVLDDITAEWAVSVATSGTDSALGRAEFSAAPDRTELILDGNVLRAGMPLLLDPVSSYRAIEETQREFVRLKVSEAMGWPTTTILRLRGDHTIQRFEDGVELRTTGDVDVSQTVDESDFVSRLQATRRLTRRGVLAALSAVGASVSS